MTTLKDLLVRLQADDFGPKPQEAQAEPDVIEAEEPFLTGKLDFSPPGPSLGKDHPMFQSPEPLTAGGIEIKNSTVVHRNPA